MWLPYCFHRQLCEPFSQVLFDPLVFGTGYCVQILLSFFIVEIRVYLQACNTRMNSREGVSNISSNVTSMVVSLTPPPPPPPPPVL